MAATDFLMRHRVHLHCRLISHTNIHIQCSAWYTSQRELFDINAKLVPVRQNGLSLREEGRAEKVQNEGREQAADAGL